jgi:hypothetical protein
MGSIFEGNGEFPIIPLISSRSWGKIFFSVGLTHYLACISGTSQKAQ